MSSPDEESHPSSPQLDDQRSALSDGDLDAEKKKKRSRRKRGARHRYRPYDLTASLEEETSSTSPSTSSPTENRKKRSKVMAPNNTTSFLLEDIEARAEMGREVEEAHSAVERQRIRSLSVSSDLIVYSDESDESVSDQDHREFETEFEEYNMDRISKLTRDEMAREILDKDKEAEVYHSNLLRVNRENARLKRLLKDNGIPLEEAAKTVIQPQAVS